MGAVVVTLPDGEPVSLDEATAHIVDPPAADHGLIEALIAAARATFERETNRSLMPHVLRLDLDAFPHRRHEIRLPFGPTSGISAVGYIDTNGAAATVAPADYLVDFTPDQARLVPIIGGWWPWTYRRPGAVSITYTAGYGAHSAADADAEAIAAAIAAARALIPPDIKRAILLMVGDLYANRVSLTEGQFGIADLSTAVASVVFGYRIRILA